MSALRVLMMSLAVLLLPSTGFLRPQRSLQVFGPVALEAKKSWKNRAAKKAGLSAASVKPATIDGKAVTPMPRATGGLDGDRALKSVLAPRADGEKLPKSVTPRNQTPLGWGNTI